LQPTASPPFVTKLLDGEVLAERGSAFVPSLEHLLDHSSDIDRLVGFGGNDNLHLYVAVGGEDSFVDGEIDDDFQTHSFVRLHHLIPSRHPHT